MLLRKLRAAALDKKPSVAIDRQISSAGIRKGVMVSAAVISVASLSSTLSASVGNCILWYG